MFESYISENEEHFVIQIPICRHVYPRKNEKFHNKYIK